MRQGLGSISRVVRGHLLSVTTTLLSDHLPPPFISLSFALLLPSNPPAQYIKKFAPILQSLPSDGEEGEDGEDGEDDDETNDEAAGDNGLTEDMMSDYQ